MANGGGPGGPGPGGHGPGGHGFGFGGFFAGGSPHLGVPRGTPGHDNKARPKPSYKRTHNFLPNSKAKRIVGAYGSLAAIMAFTMVAGNILAAKVWSLGWIILDGGILLTPFGMSAQDIMNEIFYEEETNRVNAWVAIINIVVAVAMLTCIHILPADPSTVNPDFSTAFGFSARIFIASSVAYYLRALVNNHVYDQMREHDNAEEGICVRSIVSSLYGRVVDTTLFTFLAFAGRANLLTTFQQTFWSFAVATAFEAILSKMIVGPISRALIRYLK